MSAGENMRDEYTPVEFVDTTNLPEEEWLAWRRKGIGGSDAAAIMGISPFRTARDIYYDKLNIVPQCNSEENWVALKMGHLLEDLVAEIFSRKTGLKVFQIKRMFQHPLHPFMLADVDYFVSLPNGRTAILEIKTTNYNARSNWWQDGKEIVPPYYEAQGRHYMAVMNLDEVYFCCLYGNNEDETLIRHIDRNCTYESELIFLEECFWQEHVLAQIPPAYTEDGELIQQSLKRFSPPANQLAEAVILSDTGKRRLEKYLTLQERKSAADRASGTLEKEMKRLRALIAEEMGSSCTAFCETSGGQYKISYNPIHRTEVKKEGLLRLQMLYPEAYQQCVSDSEYRRFSVNRKESDVA